MDARETKGRQIAQTCQIGRKGNGWVVPSQSGRGSYMVFQRAAGFVCNCPDYELRQTKCKHVIAVEITVLKWFDAKGNKIGEIRRVQSVQNWAVYNKSQIEEKERFMALLKGLVETIPEQHREGRGRPNMPVRDLLFASALKVYSQFSLRRFMTDLQASLQSRYVDNAPCYSLVGKFMERADMTPVLYGLVEKSAMPLKGVEDRFAIDSSGFRTTKFSEYCVEKHNTKRQHQFLKAHICTGVNTNIISSCKITDENGSDCIEFAPLAQITHDNGFTIAEMTADKAYSSRDNLECIASMDGKAYIPFKSNATGKARGSVEWKRMYHLFMYRRDEFLTHYHMRSNVESTFFMLKAKFNDMLKSRTRTAQINELLLKILCHNIVVVNSAMNELGVVA
ncbi:MAG: transposase [Candidatus Micrarchaeaceae archaeon]